MSACENSITAINNISSECTYKKSIARKLANVMHKCRYVQKDKKNEYLKYNYASSSTVLGRVNADCHEEGLAVIVSPQLVSHHEKTNRNGVIEDLATVQTVVTLLDIESGETLTFSGFGSGQDVGDKAVAKAQTMALKYSWMMTLCIATGDDPEAYILADELEETNNPKTIQEPKKADTTIQCPKCGSNATLIKTVYLDEFGTWVNECLCSNSKCIRKNFRLPIEGIPA